MAFVNAREALIAGRPPRPARQTATLSTGPLFHIGGVSSIVGGPLGGSKIVLMRKWDVEEALRLAREEQVTGIGGVPAIARQILEHPRIGELDLDVRTAPMGGAPVPPDLVTRAIAVFGDSIQALNGYGLTETTSAVVTNVGTLRSRGVVVMEPEIGALASGLSGRGRLPEIETIMEALYAALTPAQDLTGEKVLAGPRTPSN